MEGEHSGQVQKCVVCPLIPACFGPLVPQPPHPSVSICFGPTHLLLGVLFKISSILASTHMTFAMVTPPTPPYHSTTAISFPGSQLRLAPTPLGFTLLGFAPSMVSAPPSLQLTWSAEGFTDQRAEVAELAVLRTGREPGQGAEPEPPRA